ncbi:hypothetical protein JD844_019936, partial [Phrynosoma platyrhinos]
RKGGHKGRARQYTSPEEIDAQLQAEKQKAKDEEEEEEGGDGATGEPKKKEKSLDSDESEEEDDEDYQPKHKGVEGMIDIENPNRVAQTAKKVTQIDLESPRELSRREREEIEKQKAKERYMKMHLAGKTEQAKADLARLAIIRKQREEAAKKKEEERKAKDEAASAGKRLQSLSLNKKKRASSAKPTAGIFLVSGRRGGNAAKRLHFHLPPHLIWRPFIADSKLCKENTIAKMVARKTGILGAYCWKVLIISSQIQKRIHASPEQFSL